MRFLLKMAFWLAVAVLLIPTGGDSSRRAELVGTGDAVSAAYGVLDDLRGFCGRQPEACEIAGRVGATFAEKAQVGARMLYEFLRDHAGDRSAAMATGGGAEPPAPAAPALAPDEMQAPWRAPDHAPLRRS